MSPQFLTIDEGMDIHCNQIKLYGGTLGVRDAALPESAPCQQALARRREVPTLWCGESDQVGK